MPSAPPRPDPCRDHGPLSFVWSIPTKDGVVQYQCNGCFTYHHGAFDPSPDTISSHLTTCPPALDAGAIAEPVTGDHFLCVHTSVASASPKILDLPALLRLREDHRQAGRTVAWTNGCFDLLHPGHLHSLQAARALADVLVVGLNDDATLRRLKGPGRPLLPAAQRAELLAGLACVDHVLIFADDTPAPVLDRLRPDVHCKGADYAPPHGKPLPERAIVEAYGGRVAFLSVVPGLSTTALLRRLRALPEPPAPGPE